VTTEDPEPDTRPRDDEPRANVAYKLEVEGQVFTGTTDGDGRLEHDIPPDAARGQLILEPDTPNESIFPLNLGHLDPVSELSGVKQRLANLSYGCGDCDDEETPQLAEALRAFQAKHGLSINGEADDATRNKLKEVHGA